MLFLRCFYVDWVVKLSWTKLRFISWQGLISDAKQKTQVLNYFFGSVFTKKDITDIPVPNSCFGGGCEAKLVDIVIDPEIVAAKLRNLKSDKAAGDDDNLSLTTSAEEYKQRDSQSNCYNLSQIARHRLHPTRLENSELQM